MDAQVVSSQTPEWSLLVRRPAQKAPAQASVRVTALDEGLVHVFTVFTHVTTLGGDASVLGDRMAAQIALDRLKSLGAMGSSSLRTSAHFCTRGGSAETTNTGRGRQHFWRKGSGGQHPA